MITGTLMYDIAVEASDAKDLERIGSEIRVKLKEVKGITDSEEVDSDVVDDADDEQRIMNEL